MSLAHIKMFRGEHLPVSKRKIVEKIMSAISHLGDKAGLWLCVQVSYHFQNQAHSFITGTQMCLFIFISQTVKSILREPRPLMIDSGINVKDCKHLEYGNPSSHTYGSSFLYITTVYLLAKHFIIRYRLKNWFVPMMLLLNLTFFGIYVIGFSRVYKGVHTYNQVLSGLMQGTILALI